MLPVSICEVQAEQSKRFSRSSFGAGRPNRSVRWIDIVRANRTEKYCAIACGIERVSLQGSATSVSESIVYATAMLWLGSTHK